MADDCFEILEFNRSVKNKVNKYNFLLNGK